MVDQVLDVIPLRRMPWFVKTKQAVPLCTLRALSTLDLLKDLSSTEAAAHVDKGLPDELKIMLEVAFS